MIETFDIPDGADTILFDSITGDGLYLYGKKVAEIEADFVFAAPAKRGKQYCFVSVTFGSGGKRYDHLCDIPLAVGDRAVVETQDGETTVTVAAVFEKKESEMALPLKRYKRILRRA